MTTQNQHHIVPSSPTSDVLLSTGVRVHYVEQGNPAGPAVILLHGITDSWFSWSEILPRLSPDYHVFALDQRGHGDSDRPESGYAVSDFAADVLAFMDATGLPAATVAGHSMGSFIAQRVASIAPQRIERLVLVGSSAIRTPSLDELHKSAQSLTDPVPAELVREFQSSTIARPVAEAFLNRVVAESLKGSARTWQAVTMGWLAEVRWADLARVRMPTLIVWGDQDVLFSRADQDVLLAALPHARLVVYEGTGHTPQWEEPQRFARDLEAFLRTSVPMAA